MFSEDCRATVIRHSYDIRTSVARLSHVHSPKFRGDRFAQAHAECRTTVA